MSQSLIWSRLPWVQRFIACSWSKTISCNLCINITITLSVPFYISNVYEFSLTSWRTFEALLKIQINRVWEVVVYSFLYNRGRPKAQKQNHQALVLIMITSPVINNLSKDSSSHFKSIIMSMQLWISIINNGCGCLFTDFYKDNNWLLRICKVQNR